MWLWILLLILFVLLIAALPAWPYTRRGPYAGWGYYPSGLLTLLIIILIIVLIVGLV
jgi:hypothetical protein